MSVQILPTVPTVAQSFAKGLSETLRPQFQQEYQRNLIKKSMGEVRDLAKNPDATSFDLASALISSTAGVPGAEKYIGQLFPVLNEQLQRERSLKNFQGQPNQFSGTSNALEDQIANMQKGLGTAAPKLKAGGVPKEQEAQQEAPQPPDIMQFYPPAENYNPALAPPGQIPTMQLPYPNPGDFKAIRDKARSLNFTPEWEERLVNDAKEANQNARDLYSFKQVQYNQDIQEGRDYLEKFNNIKDYINQNGPEFSGSTVEVTGPNGQKMRVGDPDDMQLALKVADEVMNEQGGTPQQVLAEVKKRLRPYQQSVNSLNKALDRPLFGLKGEALRSVQDKAQQMVRMGQKDKLRLMIANNGHGQVEEAKILNPLPEPIDNYFRKRLEKQDFFIPIQETMPSLDPDKPNFGMGKLQEKRANKRQQQLDDMRNYLAENITSGTYEDPGTNLLLLRRNLQDLGLPWQESGRLIEDALRQKSGEQEFKLDSHQSNDYTKLAYPPITPGAYLWNILTNLFFGKE